MIKIYCHHCWKHLQCLRLNVGGIKKKILSKTNCGNFAIRCTNCGKETIIDSDLLKTDYQEIITTFAMSTMLHHVGMIWIIENHEDLKYDMELQN